MLHGVEGVGGKGREGGERRGPASSIQPATRPKQTSRSRLGQTRREREKERESEGRREGGRRWIGHCRCWLVCSHGPAVLLLLNCYISVTATERLTRSRECLSVWRFVWWNKRDGADIIGLPTQGLASHRALYHVPVSRRPSSAFHLRYVVSHPDNFVFLMWRTCPPACAFLATHFC